MIHSFEFADKSAKTAGQIHKADGKRSAKVFATSCHKNIKDLALGDLHTSLIDTMESGSCNYELVLPDTIDSNKDMLIPT
jgi:hypothetical protein